MIAYLALAISIMALAVTSYTCVLFAQHLKRTARLKDELSAAVDALADAFEASLQ